MPAAPVTPRPAAIVNATRIEEIARALRSGEKAALFLGGAALGAEALLDAQRVVEATGAALLAETFPTCMERGAGLPEPTRLAYLAEFAEMRLPVENF